VAGIDVWNPAPSAGVVADATSTATPLVIACTVTVSVPEDDVPPTFLIVPPNPNVSPAPTVPSASPPRSSRAAPLRTAKRAGVADVTVRESRYGSFPGVSTVREKPPRLEGWNGTVACPAAFVVTDR
jgi:hypothetical protein